MGPDAGLTPPTRCFVSITRDVVPTSVTAMGPDMCFASPDAYFASPDAYFAPRGQIFRNTKFSDLWLQSSRRAPSTRWGRCPKPQSAMSPLGSDCQQHKSASPPPPPPCSSVVVPFHCISWSRRLSLSSCPRRSSSSPPAGLLRLPCFSCFVALLSGG